MSAATPTLTVTEQHCRGQLALPGSLSLAALLRVVLWESFLLGVFGAVAGAVVGAMTAGVLSSTNIHVPLSLQLFLMSDAAKLAVLPSALGGAVALISLVAGLSALCPEDNQPA